jgi:hypothetical protein
LEPPAPAAPPAAAPPPPAPLSDADMTGSGGSGASVRAQRWRKEEQRHSAAAGHWRGGADLKQATKQATPAISTARGSCQCALSTLPCSLLASLRCCTRLATRWLCGCSAAADCRGHVSDCRGHCRGQARTTATTAHSIPHHVRHGPASSSLQHTQVRRRLRERTLCAVVVHRLLARREKHSDGRVAMLLGPALVIGGAFRLCHALCGGANGVWLPGSHTSKTATSAQRRASMHTRGWL